MKAIITALALLFVTGAFAQRGNVSINSATPTNQTGVQGVVSHFDGRACDFYITATVNGQEVKYLPSNLPAEFDIDGKLITFDFVTNEDRFDETCVVAAITVSNVKARKKAQSIVGGH